MLSPLGRIPRKFFLMFTKPEFSSDVLEMLPYFREVGELLLRPQMYGRHKSNADSIIEAFMDPTAEPRDEKMKLVLGCWTKNWHWC